jgi:hypothetical protein
MNNTADLLQARASTPLQRLLLPVLSGPTSLSSSGYPYLSPAGYAQLLHRVPQTLQLGTQVWDALDALTADPSALTPPEQHDLAQSKRVVQQVLRTATITAPPTLWLARHVLDALHTLGLSERLLQGERLDPREIDLDPVELDTDLSFLTVLGLLTRHAGCFELAAGPEPRRVLSGLPIGGSQAGTAQMWAAAACGEPVDPAARTTLLEELQTLTPRTATEQIDWCPQLQEIALGAVLLPLIVGLAAHNRCQELIADPSSPVTPSDPELEAAARHILSLCGALQADTLHPLGRRLLDRGPGPFGIVEAYHPYMAQAPTILSSGRGPAHVERSGNIAASQRANRDSFRRANDALDRYCTDTGFRYSVFIEHALGRGEATRQRYVRSGDARIRYVGADLEDAAIDAAKAERDAGTLPHDMCFVRQADIGRPEILIDAMAEAGIPTQGAVMMVGNGFHEIRAATDARLSAVFAAYCQAGITLMFTEETALSIADQRATGWNTYQPAFRYVHEKSGQGLRPALSRPDDPSDPMPTSWSSLAQSGGYTKLEAYCSPGRTIYPSPPASGHNPSTSMNYFFVPRS